jgi:hypothetical protein
MIAAGHSMFRVDDDPSEHFVEWYINTDPIVMEIRFNGVPFDTADPIMRTYLETLLTAMSDQRSDPASMRRGA